MPYEKDKSRPGRVIHSQTLEGITTDRSYPSGSGVTKLSTPESREEGPAGRADEERYVYKGRTGRTGDIELKDPAKRKTKRMNGRTGRRSRR